MSLTIFKSGSGSVQLELGDQHNNMRYRHSLGNQRKLEWELKECQVSLTLNDNGILPLVKANEATLIRKILLVLPLRKEWTSMLGQSRRVNWCFLGSRGREHFCLIQSEKEQGEIRFSISSNKLSIEWFCEKTLLSGESFYPGHILYSIMAPGEFPKTLPLGKKRRNDRPFLKWREFHSQDLNVNPLSFFRKDLEMIKEGHFQLNGYLLSEELIPQPGVKQGSRTHKQMEDMITELRKLDFRAALKFYPLRIHKKHPYCQENPTWFLQDSKGNPLLVKHKRQCWQVLDVTHRDVQQFLVNRVGRIRSWGFIFLMMQGLDDLLLSGIWQDNQLSQKDRIELFFNLVRKGAGEGAVLTGDRFFSCCPDSGMEFHFPGDTDIQSPWAFEQMTHLYPLTHAGAGFSMGPLYLNAGSSNRKEAHREAAYNMQLLAGGFAILGGDSQSLDQEAAEKWNRLADYHTEKGVAQLRLEAMGFRQNFVVFQSKKGILAAFNRTRRKGYLKISRETTDRLKKMTFNDQTSLSSPDLTILIPSNRSRILRF